MPKFKKESMGRRGGGHFSPYEKKKRKIVSREKGLGVPIGDISALRQKARYQDPKEDEQTKNFSRRGGRDS